MIIDGQAVKVGGATIPVSDVSVLPPDPDGRKEFPYSPAALLQASFSGAASRLKDAGLGAELRRAEEKCAAAVAAAARCLAPLRIPASVVKAAVEKAIREHDSRAPERPRWMKYVLRAEERLTDLGLKPGSLQGAVEDFMRSPWADPSR